MSLGHDGICQSLVRQVLAVERPEFESRKLSLNKDVVHLCRELTRDQVQCLIFSVFDHFNHQSEQLASCVCLVCTVAFVQFSLLFLAALCFYLCKWMFIKVRYYLVQKRDLFAGFLFLEWKLETVYICQFLHCYQALCLFSKWTKITVAFIFIQERVLDSVLELEGSIIDNEKMSGLLDESQTNIDQHRSMLHQLHYLQVFVTFMAVYVCHTLPLITLWHSRFQCSAEYVRDLQIGNFSSNWITNRLLRFEFESNLKSNQCVVVYV